MAPIDQEPPAWDLVTRWRRFRRETRGGGAWHVIHRLSSHIVPRNLLKLGSVHIIALELREPLTPTEPGTARMRRATRDDIDAIVAKRKPRSESLRQKFSRGSEIWVVERAGTLVAYDICGAKTKVLADWIRLEAPDRETWAIGIWVAPEARGQGLAVQLRRRVAREFQKLGFVRLLGTISATNSRSIRTFEKLGAEFIGRVDFVRLFGFGIVRFDGRLRAGRWTNDRVVTLSIAGSSGRAASGAPQQPTV